MRRTGKWRGLKWTVCLLAAGGCTTPFSGAGNRNVAPLLDENAAVAEAETTEVRERAPAARRRNSAVKPAQPVSAESVSPDQTPVTREKPTILDKLSIANKDKPARKPAASGKLDAQISLARLSERHGQREQAALLYEAILRKDPGNNLAQHRLGVIAARGGDYAEAEAYFQKAGDAGADSAEYWNDRGYCAYLRESPEEAEKWLRLALQRDPQHKAAHNNLGLVLGERGQFDESLAQFKKAVGDAEAHANLAYVKSQVGDYEGAEQSYHHALRMNGELRPAAEALVQLPKNQKRIDQQAVRPATRAAELTKAKSTAEAKETANSADQGEPSKPSSAVAGVTDEQPAPEDAVVLATGSATRRLEPRSESVASASFNSPVKQTAAEVAQQAFQQQSTAAARPTHSKPAGERLAIPENSLRKVTSPAEGTQHSWQRPTWTPSQP